MMRASRLWSIAHARAPAVGGLGPAGAIIIGAVVRLTYVLQHDFPLNDGGLFYLMTQELQRNGYALPMQTAYNGAGIPFAYPPMGFYMAGLLDQLGPWSLLDVFCYLPLALNVLTVAAFHLLSRAVLPSRRAATIAVFVFAMLPRSFNWLLMGGGVARASGFLFAILGIWQGYLLYARHDRRRLLPAVVFSGAAVLSHAEMGLFVAYTLALFALAYGRHRQGVIHSMLLAGGTLAVTAPWWGTIIARHGLTTFISASQATEPTFSGPVYLLMLLITDEPYFALLGGLAFVGLLASLGERKFLLPVWLAAMFLLDRRCPFATAPVALALLAGLGMTDVLLPILSPTRRSLVGNAPDRAAGPAAGSPQRIGSLGAAVLAFSMLYAVFSALVGSRYLLASLSEAEREAMAWVAQRTPTGSTFLVITGDIWYHDRVSEWFPVLADRASVATAQGYEWLPAGAFYERVARHKAARRCAREGADCLEALEEDMGVSYTHVYVAKQCAMPQPVDRTAALRCSLQHDPGYRIVYDSPAAAVYSRLVPTEK